MTPPPPPPPPPCVRMSTPQPCPVSFYNRHCGSYFLSGRWGMTPSRPVCLEFQPHPPRTSMEPPCRRDPPYNPFTTRHSHPIPSNPQILRSRTVSDPPTVVHISGRNELLSLSLSLSLTPHMQCNLQSMSVLGGGLHRALRQDGVPLHGREARHPPPRGEIVPVDERIRQDPIV